MPLLSGEALVTNAVFMATLYALGYTIASAKDMPLHWILTFAGESMFLGVILCFYVDNYLNNDPPLISNMVFILAVIITIVGVFVLYYERQKLPQSQTEASDFVEEVFQSG